MPTNFNELMDRLVTFDAMVSFNRKQIKHNSFKFCILSAEMYRLGNYTKSTVIWSLQVEEENVNTVALNI